MNCVKGADIYMQKIGNIFYRFSQGLTLGIGGCLLLMSSLAMIVYGIMYGNHHYGVMTSAMLLLAVLLAGSLLFLCRRTGTGGKTGTLLLFGMLICMQLFFLIFISHPMAISDPARVQNEALMMVLQQHGQINMQDGYFQRYSNNHFIVVLFYYFYKILYFMGIQKVWIPTVILNLVSIDIGIGLSWLVARRWKGKKMADILLCLFMLCPTTYVWLTTVYTNTLSFPFVMGILLLCIILQQDSGKGRRLGIWGVLGAVMAVGYWVRPTTIIPIIAVGCYFWVTIIRDGGRNLWKQYFLRWLLMAAVFVCCFAGCRGLVDRHMDRSRLTGEFPITHWIMMGLNTGTFGEYSREDEVYTMSFDTKQQKRQADIARIRERVTEQGSAGLAYQAVAKMFGVWALSDDDCFAKASYASDFPGWYQYFMGKDNTWYLLFMQAFRVVTFLFLCVSVRGQIRRNKCDPSFVLTLTFLGAVLFFVLWEANRKYNVCFMGVCLLLMADGILRAEKWLQRRELPAVLSGKWRWAVGSVFAVCCISLTSYAQITSAAQTTSAQAKIIYHCRNNPDSVAVSEVNREERSRPDAPVLLEQTVRQGQMTRKGDWEEILLNFERKQGSDEKRQQERVKNKRKYAGKKLHRKEYKIEVISLEDRRKVYSRKVGTDQLSESGKLKLRLPKAGRDSGKGYVIRLHHYGKAYTMIPKVSRFPELDPYPYGSLYMNGRKTNYDLSMSILQRG